MQIIQVAGDFIEAQPFDEELTGGRCVARLGNPARPRLDPSTLWSIATVVLMIASLLLVTGYFWRQGV